LLGVEHNHRIAGVTGLPIKCGKSYIHEVVVLTDTFVDHFHKICDITGPGDNNNHTHDYYFTTLIEDPTNVPEA
jgi:hypothetical protein